MAIDILHKILGIQTGAFDGHTLFSVRKLFFSTGNGRVRPGILHILAKKTGSPRPAEPINWDLAGKARSKCVTNAGHKVQLPLGPSTSRLSGKLGFGGPKPSPGRGWLAQRDGCGAVQLTWFRPSSAPVCALGHLPPGEGISPPNPNLSHRFLGRGKECRCP